MEGSAEVRRKGRRVNVLGPGDFLGEIALVSDRPRTPTVTTTSPAQLLVLTGRDFRTLLREVPAIQAKVLAAIAARLPGDQAAGARLSSRARANRRRSTGWLRRRAGESS